MLEAGCGLLDRSHLAYAEMAFGLHCAISSEPEVSAPVTNLKSVPVNHSQGPERATTIKAAEKCL